MQRTENQKSRSGEPPAGVSAGRLVDLLTTFTTLRRDGQALIDQIRGTLTEMRALRDQLEGHRTALPRPLRNGAQHSPNGAVHLHYGLTARELEVALLLAQGRSNAAIANTLRISTHTARHHTQHVLAKLGVHSRAEAGAKLRG